MKKILIVLTNIAKYQGTTQNRATGLWLGEAVHFVDVVEKAGYQVDYVSPYGGYVPIDPHSLAADMMSELDWQYYQNHDFMNQLAHSLSPEEIQADEYEAIYYTGGHGVLWDFPDNEQLQAIAMAIYQKGGVVSAVCHGVAGLLNLQYADGSYLVANKSVTGFSNSEEQAVELDQLVPYATEDMLKQRGAHYLQGDDWQPFAVTDERLITGQNPASGRAVAEQVLDILS